MSAVWDSQYQLLIAPAIMCGLGHKDKCIAIIDDGLTDGVLYDNWQGFHHLLSTDTSFGSLLVSIEPIKAHVH